MPELPKREDYGTTTLEIRMQTCYKCGTAWEKVQGCDHITCGRCTTLFCFICGKGYTGTQYFHEECGDGYKGNTETHAAQKVVVASAEYDRKFAEVMKIRTLMENKVDLKELNKQRYKEYKRQLHAMRFLRSISDKTRRIQRIADQFNEFFRKRRSDSWRPGDLEYIGLDLRVDPHLMNVLRMLIQAHWTIAVGYRVAMFYDVIDFEMPFHFEESLGPLDNMFLAKPVFQLGTKGVLHQVKNIQYKLSAALRYVNKAYLDNVDVYRPYSIVIKPEEFIKREKEEKALRKSRAKEKGSVATSELFADMEVVGHKEDQRRR